MSQFHNYLKPLSRSNIVEKGLYIGARQRKDWIMKLTNLKTICLKGREVDLRCRQWIKCGYHFMRWDLWLFRWDLFMRVEIN